MLAWGKLKRLCVIVDQNFCLFLPSGAILSKNCFVKHAMHLLFREQKVKIGMGLTLRWESVQGVQITVNGLYTPVITT